MLTSRNRMSKFKEYFKIAQCPLIINESCEKWMVISKKTDGCERMTAEISR